VLRLKIGIHLPSLRMPLRKAIPRAAELGAEAIEIDGRGELKPRDLSDTAVREIRKLLEDNRLRVAAISFRTRRGYDTPDELERRIDATRQAMDMAYRLGAGVVTNHIGDLPDDDSNPRWQLLVSSLTELGHHAQKSGAMLAAQTGTDSGERLATLLRALPDGSLGVDFDPANLMFHGHSPADAMRFLGGHVLHVRARDAVRDLGQRRVLEMPLGQGSIDFPELLAMLEEHDYRGTITVERNGEDPLADLQAGLRYLRML
jgi:sugar phosphate isomerase/epimerase